MTSVIPTAPGEPGAEAENRSGAGASSAASGPNWANTD
jgi:hypothetical protein